MLDLRGIEEACFKCSLGYLAAFTILAAPLGCSPRPEEEPAAQETVSEQEQQDVDSPAALDVAAALRAGGLSLAHPVIEIPIGTGDAILGTTPGLISQAVTGTDSVDLTIQLYDSRERRAVEQERRTKNLEEASAEMEPGALPDFSAYAACGPIFVELVQVSGSASGRQQQEQVQAILEERYGPCN